MRHTAVSLWIAHGATPKQIQVWAGHRSVATVFDRYGHLFPGGENPIMEALDETHGSVRTNTIGHLSSSRSRTVDRNRAPYLRHDEASTHIVSPDRSVESLGIPRD